MARTAAGLRRRPALADKVAADGHRDGHVGGRRVDAEDPVAARLRHRARQASLTRSAGAGGDENRRAEVAGA